MTIRQTPTPSSPRTAAGHQDQELLNRALNDLEEEDQWVSDFIQRLNYAVEDLDGKQSPDSPSTGNRLTEPDVASPGKAP
jgi:hypothetical protein